MTSPPTREILVMVMAPVFGGLAAFHGMLPGLQIQEPGGVTSGSFLHQKNHNDNFLFSLVEAKA